VSDTEQSDWVGYLQRLIWDDREFAQVVVAAAQLGIADLVKDGPRSPADLAELSGTHEPSLYRLMRYLASRGIFVEGADQRFSMTASAEPLREDHPQSIRAFALFCGSEFYQRAWGGLADSVRTGQPAFERVYGKPFFDYLAEHSDMAQIFNGVMTRGTLREATAIADRHGFNRYRTIVDVGGGHGTLLAQILDLHPDPVGVLFDSPEVIAGAHGSIDTHVAGGRMQTVAGDFFEAVPTGADAYLLKSIIHDWDDEQAVAILKNCRAAMAADARVLIVDLIVAEGNVESAAKHRDMTMLVFLHGRERTQDEYRHLLARAGLRLVQTTPTDSGLSIIEAAPAQDGAP
jgi:hypothetical protein